MSAATIDSTSNQALTGFGLALVGVSVEQDSAYWEVHVELPTSSSEQAPPPLPIMVGVSLKRDRAFFKALDDVAPGMNSVGR